MFFLRDTCSGEARFWTGFLDRTGLRGVLVGVVIGVLVDGLDDLRVSLFLMTGISTPSFSKAAQWEDRNFEFKVVIRMQ